MKINWWGVSQRRTCFQEKFIILNFLSRLSKWKNNVSDQIKKIDKCTQIMNQYNVCRVWRRVIVHPSTTSTDERVGNWISWINWPCLNQNETLPPRSVLTRAPLTFTPEKVSSKFLLYIKTLPRSVTQKLERNNFCCTFIYLI